MGLTLVVAKSRASYVLSREREYLAEDSRVVAAAVSKRARRGVAWARRPVTRSWAGMAGGVVVASVGLALWSITVALVVLGVALVVYGMLLVDLDDLEEGAPRISRRRRP